MAEEDRKVDLGTKVVSAAAAMAAAFVARKVLTFAWTKATGKEPPTHPEDPRVALTEALTWSVLVGVSVEAARLLATGLRHVERTAARTASPPTPRTAKPRIPGRQADHCGLLQADSGGAQGSTGNT